jgi:hypothetical protein
MWRKKPGETRPNAPTRDVEVCDHTWMDRVSHVACADGHVLRARIGPIVVSPHRVLMLVRWREGGRHLQKRVSPVALLCTWMLWSAGDVVSDDSDEDAETEGVELPEFLILDAPSVRALDRSKLTALHSVIKEIAQLRSALRL